MITTTKQHNRHTDAPTARKTAAPIQAGAKLRFRMFRSVAEPLVSSVCVSPK